MSELKDDTGRSAASAEERSFGPGVAWRARLGSAGFRMASSVATSEVVPGALRRRMHRLLGLQIGEVGMRSGSRFTGNKVKIGDGSWIHRDVLFDARTASVTVGRNVAVGPGTMFITSTHLIGEAGRRAGQPVAFPIDVGDGCWIGARVLILPGVWRRRRLVLAAGSVVRSDCEPNGLYAGIPARRVRDLQ